MIADLRVIKKSEASMPEPVTKLLCHKIELNFRLCFLALGELNFQLGESLLPARAS